jgi:C_GCAxxG_C_C family probable redox protein
MSTNVESAVSLFKQGFNCAQAILATYGKEFNLERDTALKLASGFGGGMGAMGQTCGAVTGAFMIIGLKYGATSCSDEEVKINTYKLIRKFAERFKSRNGTNICKELLGCDISTEEGFRTAKEKDLFSTICPKLVQDAAEILEEIVTV